MRRRQEMTPHRMTTTIVAISPLAMVGGSFAVMTEVLFSSLSPFFSLVDATTGAESVARAARRTRSRGFTICVPEAMQALKAGDVQAHNHLLSQSANTLGDCDVIMLAHFSTARAETAVREALGRPVLTSPDSAVLKLKTALV